MFFKLIKNLIPVLFLLSLLGIALLFGNSIDIYYKRLAYTISLVVRGFIMSILPMMIVGFVANALLMLKDRAIEYFGLMIFFVVISNAIGVLFGHVFAIVVVGGDASLCLRSDDSKMLEPFFQVTPIEILTSMQALFLGMMIGYIGIFWHKQIAKYTTCDLAKLMESYQKIAVGAMQYMVMPLIPFLIFGMAMKLYHENDAATIVNSYGRIFLYAISGQGVYLLILASLNSGGSIGKFTQLLRDVMPAMITGFSTLSSVATMPVTIACAEKVVKHKEVARLFIPATVNMHLVCSAISINVISMSLMQVYGLLWPSWWMFFSYAMQFVIIMLGATGVSGGLIFMLVPLFEGVFGFDAQMSALMVTLMMLFDPMDTAANVSANALMTGIFERFYSVMVGYKARCKAWIGRKVI